MSNEESTPESASRRGNSLGLEDHATVELLAIGLGAIALGAVFSLGLVPVGFASGVGAVLVGGGIAVALYGFEFVQDAVSLQTVDLGIAFLVTAALLSEGVWAAVLAVWGFALVAIGVAAYGFVRVSRRGSLG